MVDDAGHDSSAVITTRRPMLMGERGFDFDFESVQRFAMGLIQGGMVPKGITSPGAVVGLIEAGKELGLPPMYALANLTFTNGRLGIMGDAAKALIRRSGALEPGTDFTETYSGDPYTPTWTCIVTAHRKGQPAPFSRSFSIGNAIAAKLVRLEGRQIKSRKGSDWIDYGPWSTYTDRMLMYRALGFLGRDFFSDILAGATLTEELRDYAAEPARDAAPPSDPDPLLAAAPLPVQDVIEAETVTETDVEANERMSRVAALEILLRQTNTVVGVEKVWKSAADLRTTVDPDTLDRLTLTYEHRLTELISK